MLTRRLAARGAEPGSRPGSAGVLLFHHELVYMVEFHVDGDLALLHLHPQVVVADLKVRYVVLLDGKRVPAVPDHEVGLLAARLVHYSLDQLSVHVSNFPSKISLKTSELFYFTCPAAERSGSLGGYPCSDTRAEDGYNTRRSELEEPRAQNKGPRPGAVQGHLSPQVASADDRDARLHGRGDRGSALGLHRRRGVPHYWSASLAPARALGRYRGILDARRGREVPLQPRPALYQRHRDSPPHKDAILELFPLRPLRDCCGGGPDPLVRLPGLRPSVPDRRLPRRPLARLYRCPLPVRRACRSPHWHRHRWRGGRRDVKPLTHPSPPMRYKGVREHLALPHRRGRRQGPEGAQRARRAPQFTRRPAWLPARAGAAAGRAPHRGDPPRRPRAESRGRALEDAVVRVRERLSRGNRRGRADGRGPPCNRPHRAGGHDPRRGRRPHPLPQATSGREAPRQHGPPRGAGRGVGRSLS